MIRVLVENSKFDGFFLPVLCQIFFDKSNNIISINAEFLWCFCYLQMYTEAVFPTCHRLQIFAFRLCNVVSELFVKYSFLGHQVYPPYTRKLWYGRFPNIFYVDQIDERIRSDHGILVN